MNALVRQDELAPAPMSAVSIRAQVNLIQEVMQAVMKKDVHYGTIPGTPKPSLWKPGAEVLCATFRIAPSFQMEDLSSRSDGVGFVRYRVRCVGTHQGTSIVLGEGMGECSSLEEKYKWRKAASKTEFEHTPEDRRRIKYGYSKADRREYEVQQVRAEAADQANTILKMACKRAHVAMSLNVVAASDIFTQDIEDLPPELRPDEDGGATAAAPVEQPQAKAAEAGAPAAFKPMNDSQKRMLRAKLKSNSLTEEALTAKFGKSLNDTDEKGFGFDDFVPVQAWIAKGGKD